LPSEAGEEDIFEVGSDGDESVVGQGIGEDVDLRAACDELVGDDVHAVGVVLDLVASDGLAPDFSFEAVDGAVGGTSEEDFAEVDDGHVAAQLHHVFNDVRGENDDDVVADFSEEVVEAVALAGVEAGRGLIDDQ